MTFYQNNFNFELTIYYNNCLSASKIRRMKKTLTFFLLLLCFFTFGQSRNELANSKIFVRATYFNKKNDIIGLQTRTDLADTIIANIRYHKFQTADFIDYSDKRETKTFYETFSNGIYCLLDSCKQIVHKVNYQTNKDQIGTIFGSQSQISLEYIETRTSFPRDSLIPTEKTPRKYYQKNNSEIYLVIIPDLQSLVVSSNGQFYTKQLMGDNYNDITEGLQNNFTASTKFDIQKGDEIQLFFRRKWYNDTTNLAEYQDKQFKNFKYLGDTVIDNTKTLKLEVESFQYLSGSYDYPEELLLTETEGGYYIGYQFIPFQDYKTEMKIIATDKGSDYFLQGVTFDTINGSIFQKIIQSTSESSRFYILPFFPMPFIDFGNVQGIITYSKIKGIEKGKKRERTYITDKNNIRNIRSKSKNEIELTIYFIEKAKVEIDIKDYETKRIVATIKKTSKKGSNSFIIRSDNFKQDKIYGINVNYKSKNNLGSFSTSLKIKY